MIENCECVGIHALLNSGVSTASRKFAFLLRVTRGHDLAKHLLVLRVYYLFRIHKRSLLLLIFLL